MNLLEIRSQKPDNGLATVRYSFGCTDCSPGDGSSRYRGFLLHGLIICLLSKHVNTKVMQHAKYNLTMHADCYTMQAWRKTQSKLKAE